mmetsp:Transcript_13557/g.56735  ORF Transcript_13557/g.56735 Transcript_13557/m.56735 type:complete len:212 (+) Transcript_13557:351-986(+)
MMAHENTSTRRPYFWLRMTSGAMYGTLPVSPVISYAVCTRRSEDGAGAPPPPRSCERRLGPRLAGKLLLLALLKTLFFAAASLATPAGTGGGGIGFAAGLITTGLAIPRSHSLADGGSSPGTPEGLRSSSTLASFRSRCTMMWPLLSSCRYSSARAMSSSHRSASLPPYCQPSPLLSALTSSLSEPPSHSSSARKRAPSPSASHPCTSSPS